YSTGRPCWTATSSATRRTSAVMLPANALKSLSNTCRCHRKFIIPTTLARKRRVPRKRIRSKPCKAPRMLWPNRCIKVFTALLPVFVSWFVNAQTLRTRSNVVHLWLRLCRTKFICVHAWLIPMQAPRTIEWIGGADGFVRLIDQTLLPTRLEYRDCRTVEEIWEAIKVLRVRGAPAIGVAAAMGVVLGMQQFTDRTRGAYARRLHEVTDYLRTSRPTAVNLFWALDRMEGVVKGRTEDLRPDELTQLLRREALA